MPAQIAVVKVVYVNNIATNFSVPVVCTGETLEEAKTEARRFILRHTEVPSDNRNRVEYKSCEVADCAGVFQVKAAIHCYTPASPPPPAVRPSRKSHRR